MNFFNYIVHIWRIKTYSQPLDIIRHSPQFEKEYDLQDAEYQHHKPEDNGDCFHSI